MVACPRNEKPVDWGNVAGLAKSRGISEYCGKDGGMSRGCSHGLIRWGSVDSDADASCFIES